VNENARTVFRLLGGFAGAPLTAVVVALVTYDALWYSGLFSGGAPIDSIDAAGSLGMGVGILAIAMTICSVPLVAWLNSRGPLSLRKVLLLGAVLGNVPFAIVIIGEVLAHPMRETLSGDIGRFWYGFTGAVQRVTVGLACGMASGGVFWLVGVRGTPMQFSARGDHNARE
jgi:hypothetical protein